MSRAGSARGLDSGGPMECNTCGQRIHAGTKTAYDVTNENDNSNYLVCSKKCLDKEKEWTDEKYLYIDPFGDNDST